MPPQIPSEIKIGNRTIQIVMTPNLLNPDNGAPVMGMYMFKELEIRLDSNLEPTHLIETFWHELNHAMFDYIRFQSDMAAEVESDSEVVDIRAVEERTVENFAKIFLQVIQDNNLLGIKE